jgi:uncharacterized repeat protein (TIGR01451 family)
VLALLGATPVQAGGPPPDVTIVSEQQGADFGWSVAGVGDVNGDGYDDIAVGAPEHNPGIGANRGKVYVYYGGPDGLNITPAFTDLGGTYSKLGYAVAGAGDVNADGYDDVIVGAPYTWHTDPNVSVGRVRLYLGGPDGLTAQGGFVAYGLDDSCLGWSVGGAGDLDSDGYDDVLAGDICQDNSRGRLLVYYGGVEGLSTSRVDIRLGNEEYDFFGAAVDGAGDVNGDGFVDVVVGAYGHNSAEGTGQAYVYHGSASGLSATPAITFTGRRNDHLGYAVAGGAINGDDYGDVLLGGHDSFGGGFLGVARAYHGSSSGLQSTPAFSVTRDSGEFGASVALPGDLTGDGYNDAVIGAYAEDVYTGAALLYPGGPAGLSVTPALTLTGEHEQSRFGHAVAGAGDVNGDGHPELIVGAPYYKVGETTYGKVYLYYGGDLTGLRVRKSVWPVYTEPGSVVTYTIALHNYEPADATGFALTDTLPSTVSLLTWDERPAGTTVAGRQLTWQGTLTASATLTFTFGVTHTLDYGQSATNVVSYTQSTRQGSSAATFYVWRQVYLPVVLR